ncbi:SDR family NAD(P)-dependent oxidoreductase [Streptomyces sp. XM4011]|uniref:SDR family NAD(P)-dependent oxidoreductase n=1 Tax=Streptomyces sp. XM4011 TaxID=2929780 RepID=UPI001FFB44B5|nr:SDR family NAD(P)-dependent oxidoreductase [Streptomyces sp. XM4011]MCK1814627.1 SDR family NAD(P)-dependent oxidoreductase [Streptomyces sp. XM4011]
MGENELAAFEAAIARLRALPEDDPVRLRAERAAGSFVREARRRRSRDRRAGARAADARVQERTATGADSRPEDAPLAERGTGTVGRWSAPRRCYVCKVPYQDVHTFYHRLCPGCAADHLRRRGLGTDLRGRRALLTGGRVKIGFQLALMLLRDGAELLVTSRFPADTLRRFRAVPGSDAWFGRLTVVGIDLRDPRQVAGWCDQLLAEGRALDILINNAAQTIRRPPEAYALLAAGEQPPYREGRALTAPGFTGAAPAALPAGVLAEVDAAGLLPDRAPVNSWSVRLGELDGAEVLETYLVNALAPLLLCDRLLPLLQASPRPRRYVVNVSAVEGRFTARNKTARHPHTNMAKAALNMLTRTSGPELARSGVYMSAVDTGWITDENPEPRKAWTAGVGFRTPLDVVDGAARVYDPILRGEAGDPVAGVFLKDYREADW